MRLLNLKYNTMKNLEKLTSIIQELVPGIMELKPGCNIYNNNTENIFTISNITSIGGDICINGFYTHQEGDTENSWVWEKYINNFKILGSPITIAIVLRAFYRGAEKWKNSMKINLPSMGVNSYGGVFIDGSYGVNDETYYEMIGHWNLDQDDLSLQSEETINKLLKIFEV